jgi:hypothetical protein
MNRTYKSYKTYRSYCPIHAELEEIICGEKRETLDGLSKKRDE